MFYEVVCGNIFTAFLAVAFFFVYKAYTWYLVHRQVEKAKNTWSWASKIFSGVVFAASMSEVSGISGRLNGAMNGIENLIRNLCGNVPNDFANQNRRLLNIERMASTRLEKEQSNKQIEKMLLSSVLERLEKVILENSKKEVSLKDAKKSWAAHLEKERLEKASLKDVEKEKIASMPSLKKKAEIRIEQKPIQIKSEN